MASISSHKRQKTGQLPGDISRQTKIDMLEKEHATITYSKEIVRVIDRKSCRLFKKETLRSKERARLKERYAKDLFDAAYQ